MIYVKVYYRFFLLQEYLEVVFMSRRERKVVRRNTTVFSVILLFMAGLFLFWYSVHKGISVEDSTWCLYLFWALGFVLGRFTWVYETHKQNL